MVVSTRTNERGSSVRDHTRVDPEEGAATNGCVLIEPLSAAVAVPANGLVVSTCANERGSSAHFRIGAEHTRDTCPTSFEMTEASSERDVTGPMPRVPWAPRRGGFPTDLTIAEWGRNLRHEHVPARKRYKPSVMDSGAAMVQRKGDSSPCLIPEKQLTGRGPSTCA